MLFEHRDPSINGDVPLWLSEELTTSGRGLGKIAVFVVCACLVMALLVDDKRVPIFIGAFIVGLLAVSAGWLRYQSRYGRATLVATTQFVRGQRFEGEIVTGLTAAPRTSIRIQVVGHVGRLEQVIRPNELRIGENGRIRIPFRFDIPDGDGTRHATRVRLYARTSNWPIGLGATFLLASPWD